MFLQIALWLYINIIPLVNLPASEFSSSTPPSLKHEYNCKHSKKNITQKALQLNLKYL